MGAWVEEIVLRELMIRRSFLHWKIEITIKILKPRKKIFERKEVVIG